MATSKHRTLFPIHHFVRTYMHDSKTTRRIRMFYCTLNAALYNRKCLFSGLELYVRDDWQVMTPNAQPASFQYDILSVLNTHKSKTTGCVWTFNILKDRSKYRICPFSGLELYAGYDWGVTAQNTHRNLFSVR